VRLVLGWGWVPPSAPITATLKQGGPAAILPIRLLLHDRSLLFIEPRGIALSTKLECPAYRNLKVHPDEPSLRQLCADQIGPDFQQFTTENTARDFDRVRQALGITALDLYGFSYGSNLGALYASRFPKHIRTLGVDGAIPLKTWDAFMPTHYRAMKLQLKRFCEPGNQCKADEVLQALSWAAVELRKAPRPLDTSLKSDRLYPQPWQLDIETLAGLAADLPQLDLGDKNAAPVWRLPFISALLKAYRQKDWADLEAVAVDRLSVKKEDLTDPEAASLPLHIAIVCQDWTVPWKRTSTVDQRRLEYKANAAAYEREHPNAFAPFSAEEWGMRRVGLGYYSSMINCPVQKTALPAQSDQAFVWPDALPVLVLNGDYDFQTVNEDAELAAAQFKKAQLARFKHHGHAILPASLCAGQLLREFLNNKYVADPMKCYEADAIGASIEKGKEK
jgi:pimeloyl-ACP methyl ester carboxylesterase